MTSIAGIAGIAGIAKLFLKEIAGTHTNQQLHEIRINLAKDRFEFEMLIREEIEETELEKERIVSQQ